MTDPRTDPSDPANDGAPASGGDRAPGADPAAPGRSPVGRRAVLGGAVAAGIAATVAAPAPASAATPGTAPPAGTAPGAARRRPGPPDLGPNVFVFDPSMPAAEIQAVLDRVHAEMETNQFGTQRYAFLFLPGTYQVTAQLGYYTTLAGLGRSPGGVTLEGGILVWAQDRFTDARSSLQNFWRSAENVTVVPPDGTTWWAVSQAAPLRRVDIRGQLGLFDYLGGYASGGFLADSRVAGQVINAPQQQWLTRDSTIGSWSNGVWNQVFAGVEGAPEQSFPVPPYTTLPTNPASREKPFLFVEDDGSWHVLVPAPRTDSRGTTWAAGDAAGRSLPIEDFFVARPTDSVWRINLALALGKHLILTPGIYRIAAPIVVSRPGTVVLGLGLATIEPQRGALGMQVLDVAGVDVSGIVFDAGPVESPVLMRVGTGLPVRRRGRRHSDPANPTGLQDVFFRIGGAHVGRARTSLVVNSDDVVLDNLWVWRADHGEGVGWTTNTADTGVVVAGDDVTATGLFVEHYQRYQVIWTGERGRTVMFQNEMPYDPPSQDAWRHGSVLGWAAYKVGDRVRTHEAWGLGSYCFFDADPTIHASRAFEVPVTPGVRLHDVLTVSLNAAGTIDDVVNDVGGPTDRNTSPTNLVSYPPTG